MRMARISMWQAALMMLLACAPAWPQRYNFKFYGEEEGLRNLGVQVVIQDRAGFLWAGTRNGLYRYDGARFTEFSTKDGLPGTRIESLHESSDGTLWVGTSLGLARKVKDRFETVQAGITRNLVGRQGIATGGEGQLYLATRQGLAQGDLSSDGVWQFHLVPIGAYPSGAASSVFVDRSGSVWFGCGTGLCTIERGTARDLTQQFGLPRERWFAILGNDQGDMWVRSEHSLHYRRAGSARFEALPGLPGSSTTIPTATLDFDGNILVTTDRGLARQKETGWELINVADDINTDDISSVLADHEGFIWLGLSGSGLARWLGYGEWQSWTQREGLSRSSVWSIATDPRSGGMWAGTRSGLSFAGSDGKWRNQPIAGVEWVRSVATTREGSLWIAADTAGVAYLHPGGGVRHYYELGTALHVMVDRSERVWVSTRGGLFRSTPSGGSFERLTPPGTDPDEGFEFASEDAAGQVWIGGDYGLVRYLNGSWRRFTTADGLKANAVAHAAHAPDGSVWIGYREALGLTRLIFREEQMRVEHVTVADQSGLHSDKSLFLAFDRTGRLWAGTDHGVDVFDQTRWRHLGRADGLIWDDCNSQAVFADNEGMWIGTSRGLSRYQPRKIAIPPIQPNVVLTAVRFGNQAWTRNEGAIPYDRRDLYIQYAALTFAQDSGITFKITLDGSAQERAATELNFASLDPGPHTLEVMARNSRGMWSVGSEKIAFTIATPWYLSWWFRSGCAAAILLAGWLFWLHRTNRLRQERRRLEKAVQERTHELSLEKDRAERETTVVQGQKVEIERLLVEAQQASKLKSEFLANMSHELRTPMNGVMGMTDLVLATSLEPEQREHLQSARGAADSLLRIVNDILDFSKIEAGKLDLNVIEFSLRECLDDTRKMFALPIDAKGLVYIASVAGDVPNRLVGDPDRLRQILINLVGNAVKFTDKGSIALRVERETQGTDWTLLRFEVCDTGIGIPADKCGVIFESFRQADGSTTRKYGGTGLGLSISAKLTELMGGKISVESEVRKGSTFRFTARFGLAVQCVENPASDERRVLEAPAEHPATLLRVLLAEDNLVNQRVATRLLEKRGHSVVVAATGREALTKLEQSSFDIVLMDVQMPDMDGLEATALLRERERSLNKHIPVVALTAHTMKGDREKCIQAGMDAYITKPVNAQELISVLESTAAASPTSALKS